MFYIMTDNLVSHPTDWSQILKMHTSVHNLHNSRCFFSLTLPVKTMIKYLDFELRHEKTNVLISDLVRHKPGCPATEDA